MDKQFRVILTMRVDVADKYSEVRDAISHDWITFLNNRKWEVILLPNILSNVDRFISSMNPDGLILSGGNDVCPLCQKDQESLSNCIERDIVEKTALRWFINNRLPVIGVCRGMQLINVYYGGSLTRDLSLIKGVNINHFAGSHFLDIIHPKMIEWAGNTQIITNSYHKQGIIANDLAQDLEPIAYTGPVIEGFKHIKDRVVGIQWHPEREVISSGYNSQLFNSFEKIYSDLGL